MILSRIPFFTVLILFFSCSSPQQVDLLIKNATVIDVLSGTTTKNQLVAIAHGNIVAVEPNSSFSSFQANEVIDAEGKYVMPGLWDNHVHFRGGEELIEQNKDFLSLFLAFGVTTVRDAGGDITPAVQDWITKIENKELDGPTIFTSGPKLDGSRPAWEGSISVVNDSDVQFALDSLELIDVDYVKMYDGNLTKEAYYGIIKEAEKRGLKTTGHMPLTANVLEAVELGLDGTEHSYYVLKACSPLADSLTEAGLGYGMIGDLIASYDEELAESVYSKLAEKEFFITPTQYIGKVLAELLITDHSNDSTLQYIAPEIQQTYERRFNSAKRGGERYTKTRMEQEKVFMEMIAPMYKAGILILSGSDSGAFNSFTYPGESIHEELRLFVEEAGLTPQEALITSIINGPKFFDLEDSYGSVAPGKIADLLILDGNPLVDIRQTRNITGVISHGSFSSNEKLKDLLDKIRN